MFKTIKVYVLFAPFQVHSTDQLETTPSKDTLANQEICK